jgi:hypothetical protein
MLLLQERFEIEMAELDAEEAKLVEAEEEEAWLLTLQQQSRHIGQHIEFDLPQSAYAHMDPILYKKIDWELTHGMDLLHHEAFLAADCEQVRSAMRCVEVDRPVHACVGVVSTRV